MHTSVATKQEPSRLAAVPNSPPLSPARILETGMSFWASKTLLTAIKLDLFTYLGTGSKSGEEIRSALGLHPRGLYDFLDALVALGFLKRTGFKENARYYPAEDCALFLDKNKPGYAGGLLEMCNDRLYPFWGDLEEALKTGRPQNEAKHSTGKDIFATLYERPERLEQFLRGMAGAQVGNFSAFAETFDFSTYRTLADIGGANGLLSTLVARKQPHLRCLTLDLPPVTAIAEQCIAEAGLSDRIRAANFDFMTQDFPTADVITMGNILHDWDLETKRMLVAKAYAALPAGGALVVIENIIDNERRHNAFGLLMSLNMLIETEVGYDYTFAEFETWSLEAGFQSCILLPLAGPSSAAVAYKA